MQLVGMLDSPYVRRVAISLQLLQLPFTHRSLSVFSTYAQFRAINSVVKAPSLVCDDGEVLMESTLILDYAEVLADPRRSLVPNGRAERQHALRVVGLALAACEKSVQLFYERTLRPAEKQHEPWAERVTEQLLAAYAALDEGMRQRPLDAAGSRLDQAGVSSAVAWTFTQSTLPGIVAPESFPALTRFTAAAEQRPEFRAAPHGSGTYDNGRNGETT